MWRQMLRKLPKNLNNVCCKTTLQKVANRKRIILHSAFLMSTAHVILDNPDHPDEIRNDEVDTPVTEIDELQLAADIEATYAQSGEALGELIQTLHACIQEICEQYQHCIVKQIEITMSCMELDPVGPHWDEITKYRVIADDLRVEFVKYKTLVATIGSIVQNDHFKSSNTPLSQAEIVHVSEAYQKLLNLIETKMKENSSLDLKLIDVNMNSILVT